MSDIHIVRDYPRSPAKVWRAVTDPALIPLWTATGAGGRPEGFAATAGTKFRFVAKPKPGWSGDVTEVAYRLEPRDGGTRLTYTHTGFTGVGWAFMAKLLGRVRRKMLTAGLPAVLDDLDDGGTLRPSSTLKPKSLG